ncbi:hypothetical protein ACA910_016901 [Epithemia clementina (nom. ined.)]
MKNSSVNGSMQSFGPFIQAFLGGEKLFCKECSSNPYNKACQAEFQNQSVNNTILCPNCRDTIDSGLEHFLGCHEFRRRWSSTQYSISNGHVSLLSLEIDLHRCVRHLCRYCCFFKAYAPAREWHKLRQAATLEFDESISNKLDGWHCFLDTPTSKGGGSATPRVKFVSPGGESIHTVTGVLIHLSKQASRNVKRFGTKTLDSPNNSIVVKISFPPFPSLHLGGVASPLGLLEEILVGDPWQLLLSTILLNRTTRIQVDKVLFELLEMWPTPQRMLDAEPSSISKVIRPLGIHHRRALGILKFTRDYLQLVSLGRPFYGLAASFMFSREDILSMHSCGEYAYAAYRLFVQRNRSGVATSDQALLAYSEFQRAGSKDSCSLLSNADCS